MKTITSAAMTAASLAALLVLGGCQENLVRSDFISPHAGDAVAHNMAVQTIDPWPAHAYDTDIATSAKRQADARAKYEDRHVPDTGGGMAQAGAIPKKPATAAGDPGGKPAP